MSIDLGIDDPNNWLFIAMSHWQLDAKTKARKWYEKSLEWLRENDLNEELKGFYAEAAELLGEAPGTEAKPAETRSTDQEKSPEKTPPAYDAQDQPTGK